MVEKWDADHTPTIVFNSNDKIPEQPYDMVVTAGAMLLLLFFIAGASLALGIMIGHFLI